MNSNWELLVIILYMYQSGYTSVKYAQWEVSPLQVNWVTVCFGKPTQWSILLSLAVCCILAVLLWVTVKWVIARSLSWPQHAYGSVYVFVCASSVCIADSAHLQGGILLSDHRSCATNDMGLLQYFPYACKQTNIHPSIYTHKTTTVTHPWYTWP